MDQTRFDLEAEIRDLAARRDINGAVQRYMRGLDRLDAELVASAFHADAKVDCGLMCGSAGEFVTFSMNLLKDLDATHHMLGQVDLKIEGDRGTGECYFQAWHRAGSEDAGWSDMFISGRYLDAYECRSGDWRIVARTLVTDWVIENPGDMNFFAANPAAPRGGRQGTDPSQMRPDHSVREDRT